MANSQPPPDAGVIRQTAAEILQRSEYQLDRDTRLGDTIVDIIVWLFEWLIYPFRWLFNAMDGLPEGFRWVVVIGLVLLLIVLVGHLLYTLVVALRPATRRASFSSALDAKHKLSAKEYEDLAQQAFAQQDYIAAVRFLFRASLAHLQSIEGRPFSPGLTNRQYVHRYRKSPFVGALQSFVEVIDQGWYGNGICREEEFQRCREAYAEIRRQTKAGSHADGA